MLPFFLKIIEGIIKGKWNDASKHVMEKCGMKYDHFVEKEFEYLGEARDLTYYVIER